jgi:glycosyltransferase involved in cell wall biosynthesis
LNSLSTTSINIDRRNGDAAESRPSKLALVCDLREEHWPSMDLFGDMLFQCFTTGHAREFEVEQLLPALRPRFSKLPKLGASRMFWNADRLTNRFYDYPLWLRKHRGMFDLFHIMDHSYAQLALELPPERIVITCHDLDTFRCLLEPEAEPRPRWFQAMARRTLRGFLRASEVICPSVFTRQELLRHNLFSPNRITVIPPGIDPIFFEAPVNGSENAAEILGVNTQPYLLHVGSTIRRKRIDVLLKVFAKIADKFPELRLVRVGGPFTVEQSRLATELGILGKIVQAPHLSKAELAAIYRNAVLLLQTSDSEGFGLPVIEAMACGCPVIASDIAPLREAGSSAATYCKVADVEAWSEQSCQMLREWGAAGDRWETRRRGVRQHASNFTWSENARQTLGVYRRVLNVASGIGRP